MGYWNQGSDGSSLHDKDTGLVWGDTPADIFDSAIEKVVAAFRADIGREPTKAEVEAGFKFSLSAYDKG